MLTRNKRISPTLFLHLTNISFKGFAPGFLPGGTSIKTPEQVEKSVDLESEDLSSGSVSATRVILGKSLSFSWLHFP